VGFGVDVLFGSDEMSRFAEGYGGHQGLQWAVVVGMVPVGQG